MPDMTPAEELAFDADLLLSTTTTDRERTVAELLNYVAATWDHHTPSLREHAQAVARAHTAPREDLPPRLRAALDVMARRGPVVELTAPDAEEGGG